MCNPVNTHLPIFIVMASSLRGSIHGSSISLALSAGLDGGMTSDSSELYTNYADFCGSHKKGTILTFYGQARICMCQTHYTPVWQFSPLVLLVSPIVLPVVHPLSSFHLIVEVPAFPSLISPVDILPRNLCVSSTQNVSSGTRAAPKHSRPPLPSLTYLHLHPPSDGFADTEIPTQHVHFEIILRHLPVLEPSFERMG